MSIISFNKKMFAAIFLWVSLLPVCSAESVSVQDFGKTHMGESVQKISLANDTGMRVSYLNYGATIVAVVVPDNKGVFANVVLSLPDIGAYEKTQRRWAGIIGRYAGRIAHGRFDLNNTSVQLETTARGYSLHSGTHGYDSRIWTHHEFNDADSLGTIFELDSPDGDQNFPGELKIRVTYRLMRTKNEFHIEYAAHSSKSTAINLTNHAYFNLAGAGHSNLDTHQFQIAADRYLATDTMKIPTGKIFPVRGTPLDFQLPVRLFNQDGSKKIVDHSLVFTDWDKKIRHVATVFESGSGRTLDISTSEPSAQFNSGDGFDGTEIGSEGIAYTARSGFAFEPGHFPDSPNQPSFPPTIYQPDEGYLATTIFEFAVLGNKALDRQQ